MADQEEHLGENSLINLVQKNIEEKKEIKNWNSSIKAIKQSKENLLRESWEPVLRYQKGSFNYFKKNAKNNEKITKSFENDLNFFVPEKKVEEEEEDYEPNESNG